MYKPVEKVWKLSYEILANADDEYDVIVYYNGYKYESATEALNHDDIFYIDGYLENDFMDMTGWLGSILLDGRRLIDVVGSYIRDELYFESEYLENSTTFKDVIINFYKRNYKKNKKVNESH